jgi:uncharacterized protein YbjT (DUF2867 family)
VATNGRTVTVFGGTGFLGRRIVRHLRSREFRVRIASRHPDRGYRQFGPDDPQLQSLGANIHDERSVADALAGAYGAVNAVSLYLERGQETFHSVHVESAQRVAAQAQPGRSRTACSHFRYRSRRTASFKLRRSSGDRGNNRQHTIDPHRDDRHLASTT